jgi:hypothetical protein
MFIIISMNARPETRQIIPSVSDILLAAFAARRLLLMRRQVLELYPRYRSWTLEWVRLVHPMDEESGQSQSPRPPCDNS